MVTAPFTLQNSCVHRFNYTCTVSIHGVLEHCVSTVLEHCGLRCTSEVNLGQLLVAV